jgi:hypothetical protein
VPFVRCPSSFSSITNIPSHVNSNLEIEREREREREREKRREREQKK